MKIKSNLRRSFLNQSLFAAGVITLVPSLALSATKLIIGNVTEIYSVEVESVNAPTSVDEVSKAISGYPGKISIGGGRYSMGGQVAVKDGLHIDLRKLSNLIWFKPSEHAVRVQSGMRWRDLQDIIDPYNLSIKTMQSYSNFTVGGSLSVNAHGRYVGNGPIINSVKAISLVLANGSIAEATPLINPELFKSAIGGYGAVGVIVEVELELVRNVKMERIIQKVELEKYPDFFNEKIKKDSFSIMHNADLLPPNFEEPIAITWRETNKPVTEEVRLTPRNQYYGLEQNVVWSLTELPGSETLRKDIIAPWENSKKIVKWRNHEASLDVAELAPRTRLISTYVLQEYFIPVRNFAVFAKKMANILKLNKVEALNVSIRHAQEDTVSILPWAKEEVFSFVLYFKQRTTDDAKLKVGVWTRELIAAALANQGRYYLPYQLHATKEQFNVAYPEVAALKLIKKQVDPRNKFGNELWTKYL